MFKHLTAWDQLNFIKKKLLKTTLKKSLVIFRFYDSNHVFVLRFRTPLHRIFKFTV